MQHSLAVARQAPPRGVIETLSAGYAALNRHLWLALLPVLVDVCLWLGPHVSYSPLVDPAVTHAAEWVRQLAAGPRRGTRPAGIDAPLDTARGWLISRVDDTNALGLVVRGPLGLPSLSVALATPGELRFVSGWPEAVALLAGSLIGGLSLGGAFYSGLAAASRGTSATGLAAESRGTPSGSPAADGRGTPEPALPAVRRAARDVVRVLGLAVTVLGVALLLGLPLLVVVGATALLAPLLAVLGLALAVAGLVFAQLHLFFATSAIFVSGVGPLAAVQRSVGVVRRHLWDSLGLIGLTWLILAGMQRAWELLAASLPPPFGMALGILGNAYIASGLIVASMIFYHERAELARPVVEPA